MDVPTFRVRFPFFRNVDAPMVAAVLAEATKEVDPIVWRALTDTGIGLLAADKLARDPQGGDTRLVAEDGTTTYSRQFEELRAAVVVGIAVSGGCRVMSGGWW